MEHEMGVELTLTTKTLGDLLSATADAIRHIEAELRGCRPDAREHREFLEERLETHYRLNRTLGATHWSVQRQLGSEAPGFLNA
ncbi:hypothetical protein IB237_00690 [Agrobacterium sp. AGB01]|uniref:hypothetical protein n=1 Tax=Agrobacterium sp. AGB01 TaxID=2769302 RepID=UPI00177F73A4|nr:hypothetical protein [Agrobacterium sp. AGB01]MBD9385679.1 hypothetical protein [Agrobacterium sp. AGB01]